MMKYDQSLKVFTLRRSRSPFGDAHEFARTASSLANIRASGHEHPSIVFRANAELLVSLLVVARFIRNPSLRRCDHYLRRLSRRSQISF